MDYIIAFLYDLWPIAKAIIPAALVWIVYAILFRKNKVYEKEMRAYRAEQLLEAIYTPTGRFIAVFKGMPAVRQNAIMAMVMERERQIVKEGYSPAHDMGHDNEEFAAAASLYAMPDVLRNAMTQPVPAMWPWDDATYKPKPMARHRDWERSCALLLAALEKEYTFKALPTPDIGVLRYDNDGNHRQEEIRGDIASVLKEQSGGHEPSKAEPGSFFSSKNPPYMEDQKPVATMTLTAQKDKQ